MEIIKIILGLIFLSFLAFPLSGFQYNYSVILNNTGGTNLQDYQVKILFDTSVPISQGKMRNDCGDVRFTDNDTNTLLYSWLESGCNTSNTIFWVKVPNIHANSIKTIYLYYGNSSVTFDGIYAGANPNHTSSYAQYDNGANVFDFYDNFNGTTLDGSKWQIVGSGGTLTINNSLKISGSCCSQILSINKFNSSIFEAFGFATTGSSGSWADFASFFENLSGNICTHGWFTLFGFDSYRYGYTAGGTPYHFNSPVPVGSLGIFGTINNGSDALYSLNYTLMEYHFGMYSTINNSLNFRNGGGDTVYIQWTRVRKYASFEPTVEVQLDYRVITDSIEITEPGLYYILNDLIPAYSGNSYITISASNVTLDGLGHSIIQNNSWLLGLNITNVSNIHIKNIKLFNWDVSIAILDGQNITIENSVINGSSAAGITCSYSTNVYVFNNSFLNLGDKAFYAENVSGASVTNNSFYSNNIGIYADGLISSNISGNLFKEHPSGALYLRELVLSGEDCFNNTIFANKFIGNRWDIIIYSGVDNLFINNEIYNSTEESISIGPSSEQHIVKNNTFLNQKLVLGTTEVIFNLLHSDLEKDEYIVLYSTQPATSYPENYSGIGKYLNVTVSGESIWLFLNISYNESELGNVSESTLSLWKYNGTEWFNCSQFASSCGVDTNNNIVYANITDFGSIFAPLGQEDTTPPDIISGPNISTTSTSANISWITSEPSNYTISISDGSTSWTISNSTFDSSHLVTILDLSPNTTYYYNITIWDQAGNNNTYSNYNFTTNPSEQPGGQAEVVVTSAPEDREIFSLIVLILLFSFILNFKKLN
ncbi:MAG: DUF2341 domain-containing protein [archaeon]